MILYTFCCGACALAFQAFEEALCEILEVSAADAHGALQGQVGSPRYHNLERQFQSMLVHRRLQLRAALLEIRKATGGALKLGDLLSGSNVQLSVWKDLSTFAKAELGVELPVKSWFSCEEVEFKQHVLSNLGATTIFPCVHALASCPESANDVTGRMVSIPTVHGVVFSIECDTISSLAKGWASNLDCVATGSGRTGTTAVSCMTVLEHLMPAFWIAECVPALVTKSKESKKSAYDIIYEQMTALGYFVHLAMVDAQECGCPQRRKRAYIIAVYNPDAVAEMKKIESAENNADNSCSEEAVTTHHMVDEFDSAFHELSLPALGLEHYLLDEAMVDAAHVLGEEPVKVQPKKKQKGAQKAKDATISKYEVPPRLVCHSLDFA
jgi:hypothetical protein